MPGLTGHLPLENVKRPGREPGLFRVKKWKIQKNLFFTSFLASFDSFWRKILMLSAIKRAFFSFLWAKICENAVLGIQKQDDDDIYINAQIYPNIEAIKEHLKGSVPTKEELWKIISDIVTNVNSKLPNYKHIKSFGIRDKEFEKTTTQKIKRYGDNMKVDK